MTHVQSFTFSPFSENTYVLYDDTKEAVIIDPGCYHQYEKEELADFIASNSLTVKFILNTHAHLDHVFGCAFVKRKFGVKLYLHELEVPILNDVPNRCATWGIPGFEPTEADVFLNEGDVFEIGSFKLDVIHVPGHAPGHVAFINHEERFLIGGDVLFSGSVGRTDFPFCNHDDLMHSIRTKFYTLPDDYVVYAGHNEPTTIGKEKKSNPFCRPI
jgi:hydroxyacylglutathione hydrolase